MNISDSSYDKAKKLLEKSHNILILTGAGISAESGIPTFRGQNGYWRNKSVEELASVEAFAQNPRLVWDWYLERRRLVHSCAPNLAHILLARWMEQKLWTADVNLFTQNVDEFHEAAGTPGVIPLHGSLWRNRCSKCGLERREESLDYSELPLSPCCQALERPAIIWFGEQLETRVISKAFLASVKCDIVLVIGTGGLVAPASSIISTARMIVAKVIDINTSENAVSADIQIRSRASHALQQILV
jgi:NAD-dependent deacetylase